MFSHLSKVQLRAVFILLAVGFGAIATGIFFDNWRVADIRTAKRLDVPIKIESNLIVILLSLVVGCLSLIVVGTLEISLFSG